MVKSDEKGVGPSFVDHFHYIQYLEKHYGAQVELHFTCNEDDPRNALLCLTSVRSCRHCRTGFAYDYTSQEVAYDSLSRVPSMAFQLFLELNERLDAELAICLRCLPSIRR